MNTLSELMIIAVMHSMAMGPG